MITSGKGCLLAHTMGLGKTLQIIAFLITLSSLSADANVEMPTHLKKDNRRYMIVCPPTIVENWQNEFKRWTPLDCYDHLGRIFCVNQSLVQERATIVRQWFRVGGVLLSMNYIKFFADN